MNNQLTDPFKEDNVEDTIEVIEDIIAALKEVNKAADNRLKKELETTFTERCLAHAETEDNEEYPAIGKALAAISDTITKVQKPIWHSSSERPDPREMVYFLLSGNERLIARFDAHYLGEYELTVYIGSEQNPDDRNIDPKDVIKWAYVKELEELK